MNWRGVIAASALAAFGLLEAQTPESGRIQALERRLAEQRRLLNDWGGLVRYGSENTELPKLRPGEKRVVFFGDQITENWARDDPEFFRGKPWLDRGIAGQTTSQMLVRFRQDVVLIEAKAVVILGGANDIAGVHGPATEEMILDNLASMSDIAKAHGIRVVLASITPVCECFGKAPVRQRWQERIEEANELIRDYAAKNGAIYFDFYSAMADGRNMKQELTVDGVLPNRAGYGVMAAVAEKAINEALRKQ